MPSLRTKNMTNAELWWSPNQPHEVVLTSMPNEGANPKDWGLRYSFGASERQVRAMGFRERQAWLLAQINTMVVRDGISPTAIHRAALPLDEYRDTLPLDAIEDRGWLELAIVERHGSLESGVVLDEAKRRRLVALTDEYCLMEVIRDTLSPWHNLHLMLFGEGLHNAERRLWLGWHEDEQRLAQGKEVERLKKLKPRLGPQIEQVLRGFFPPPMNVGSSDS